MRYIRWIGNGDLGVQFFQFLLVPGKSLPGLVHVPPQVGCHDRYKVIRDH